jgi:hypothetical protein
MSRPPKQSLSWRGMCAWTALRHKGCAGVTLRWEAARLAWSWVLLCTSCVSWLSGVVLATLYGFECESTGALAPLLCMGNTGQHHRPYLGQGARLLQRTAWADGCAAPAATVSVSNTLE